MKKISIALIVSVLTVNAFAQKTEFRVSLNSGLNSFYGNAAANNTSFIQFLNATSTNVESQGLLNIYGKDVQPFVGLSFDVKRITKKNFIYGVDFGIESMKSTVNINTIIQAPAHAQSTLIDAQGNTELNFKTLNLHPYIGHRFEFKKFSIDATAGVDISYLFKTQYSYNVIGANGFSESSNANLTDKKFDIRPRLQIAVNHDKFTFYTGYSFGIKNYVNNASSESNYGAFARLIRFGVSFKII